MNRPDPLALLPFGLVDHKSWPKACYLVAVHFSYPSLRHTPFFDILIEMLGCRSKREKQWQRRRKLKALVAYILLIITGLLSLWLGHEASESGEMFTYFSRAGLFRKQTPAAVMMTGVILLVIGIVGAVLRMKTRD